ncbi:MAG: cytochrome P450 [Acidobacteriota bacterium]|nr:cytochrome P450 [Acidobacteriota bacterium]
MNRADGKRAPGVSRLEFFRLMPRFRRDTLGTFAELRRRYGDVVRLKGVWTAYQLTHPRDIEHVLQTNQRNYPKSKFYGEVKSSLGDGLLTSEGELWRRQRRLAQPAFHRQRIEGFSKIMAGASREMLEAWRPFAERGEPIDVSAEMMRLTLRVVGAALFSVDLSGEMDTIERSLAVAREHLIRRSRQVVKLPLGVPTRRNRNYLRAIRLADEIIYRMIAERRRRHERGEDEADDLLTMLMRARDEETGEAMSDRQLRDEAVTIMVAGHETTALALAWAFYLLSLNAEAERKLRAELDGVLRGRAPTYEDIPRLRYATMVVSESMRLYPPAWVIARRAARDDVVGGYRVEAESEIILPPYVTHRHPEFWESPDEFDPERFTPERSEGRPRYAYFPFGGGPRQCIGNGFAMMEATLILAAVAQEYSLRLAPGHKVEPDPSVTLHARDGIRMTLH